MCMVAASCMDVVCYMMCLQYIIFLVDTGHNFAPGKKFTIVMVKILLTMVK